MFNNSVVKKYLQSFIQLLIQINLLSVVVKSDFYKLLSKFPLLSQYPSNFISNFFPILNSCSTMLCSVCFFTFLLRGKIDSFPPGFTQELQASKACTDHRCYNSPARSCCLCDNRAFEVVIQFLRK